MSASRSLRCTTAAWLLAAWLLAATAILALGAPARSAAAPLRFWPTMHADPQDAGGARVDVRGVAFGQRATKLVWRVRAAQPWLTSAAVRAGRSLCLSMQPGRAPAAFERICLGTRHGRAVLLAEDVAEDGHASRSRLLRAVVTRPDRRTARVVVAPRELSLAPGTPIRWHVEERWRRTSACPTGCVDRVPDVGTFRARVVVLAEPRCFGAAARRPGTPCVNPDLRGVVMPPPDDAPLVPESPCTPLHRPSALAAVDACAFGVRDARPRNTVALLGDSHARQWRAALEVVAQVRGWRGLSITRPGCPFSAQIPRSPDLGPGACLAQHEQTIAWLHAHPQVRTVFVSSWAEPPSGPHGGTGAYGGGPAAFAAMLSRLPASVRRVYVLRDNPGATFATPDCVAAARRDGRIPGTACALPRARVLTPDPAAIAARGQAPRVRVIDLTRRFCDAERCFPVLGGVYVYRDDNHMNSTFVTSLGPAVLQALDDGPQ